MATTTSKNPSSCSPVTSRPRNLNARTSEATDPMRRSFSATPFLKPSIMAVQRGCFFPNTPANSPSDCPQRKSISRESIIDAMRDCENKENGKDHNWKQVKVRSPSTKNFMSLTTSVASKINASPRKKVLNERNEAIHTAVSVSEVKSPSAEDLGLKTAKGLNQKKEVSSDSTITYLGEMEGPKNDAEALKKDEDTGYFLNTSAGDHLVLLSEHAIMDKDYVNLDSSFKISPRALCYLPCPALAPVDAEPSMLPYDDGDPSMLPYDPKTNYLSPRPQFLHYRPNPRIEQYLNKERDDTRLEESFVSESSSDVEVTENETQSVSSQREFQDASSVDVVKQEEGKVVIEEDEALSVSELNTISASEGVKLNEEEKVSRPHFFRRTKVLTVLPVLAIACFLVLLANSSVMDSFVLNNLSSSMLYVPPEISEIAQKSLESAAQQFWRQLNHLISCSNNLVASFREAHKPGSLKYNNLSILLNDGLVDSDHVFDHSALGSLEKYENKEEELQSRDADEEIENYLELGHQQFEEQVDIAAGYVEDVEIVAEDRLAFPMEFGVSEAGELNLAPQIEVIRFGKTEAEAMAEEIESGNYKVEFQSETYHEDKPNPIPEASKTEQGSFDAEGETDMNHAEPAYSLAEKVPKSLYLDAALRSPQNSQTGNLAVNGVKDTFSEKFNVQISLFILSLLGATAFICMKNQKIVTQNAASAVVQVSHYNKKINNSTVSVSAGYTFLETNVDMVGDSCPSEMSSLRSISSYINKGLTGTSEPQSGDRSPRKSNRRESLASSDDSAGSPSYGSFTTYEKIFSKHGSKDEEVITPVRRSSRIRSQVTSL